MSDGITFEACLYPNGNCFTIDSEGAAKLVLSVPTNQMQALAAAMADGQLIDRSFVVRIELA